MGFIEEVVHYAARREELDQFQWLLDYLNERGVDSDSLLTRILRGYIAGGHLHRLEERMDDLARQRELSDAIFSFATVGTLNWFFEHQPFALISFWLYAVVHNRDQGVIPYLQDKFPAYDFPYSMDDAFENDNPAVAEYCHPIRPPPGLERSELIDHQDCSHFI